MARALPTEVEESSDPFPEEEGGGLQSGTRRAVARAGSDLTEGDLTEGEEKKRESQRPTFRVPSSAGLAGYLDAPPRIDGSPDDIPPGMESLAQIAAAIDASRALEAPPAFVERAPFEARPTERTLLLPVARELELDEGEAQEQKPRGNTLRVRLTPYAREHAIADGDTDDTPAAMLQYVKLLGSFERVPYVNASMREVMMAKLDHREGFVLSLVDGASDIDTILDACPMPTHKTLRILHGLCERGILGVR
jgi:hypothetical protein